MDYTEVIKTHLYINVELNINNLLYIIEDTEYKKVGLTIDDEETALIITENKQKDKEKGHETIIYYIGYTLHLQKDTEENNINISIINKTKFKEIQLNENLINYGYRKKDEKKLLEFYDENPEYIKELKEYKDIYINYKGVLIDGKEDKIIKPFLIPFINGITYYKLNNKLVDIDNILNTFSDKYTLHYTK